MTMTNFSFSWVNKYSQELTICFWRQALHYMVHLIVWNHFQIPEKSFQSVHLWKPPLIQTLGTQMFFTWKFPESCLFGWNFETWKFVTSKCVPPLFVLCLQTDISTKSQKGIFCSGLDTVPMRRPTSIAIFSLGPPASSKPLSKSWVPSLCGFFSSAPTINEMTSCHSGDNGSLESFKASRIMRQHFSVNLSGSIHNRIRDRNTGGFSTSIARSLRFARTTITCKGSETEIGQISNEQLVTRHHWITVWGAYIDLESYQSATPNKSLVGTYPTFASRTVAASPSPTTRTRLRCGCTSLTTRTSFKPASKHFPKMLLISSLETQQSGETFSRNLQQIMIGAWNVSLCFY